MATDLNKNWLLVVEDNADIWTILKLLLPQVFPGITIIHVADESAALACLQKGETPGHTPPRLILHNFYLPDQATGVRLISTFKGADSPYRQISLVVMSSSTNPHDSQQAYEAGADSFLTKPTGLDQWVKTLQTLKPYLH